MDPTTAPAIVPPLAAPLEIGAGDDEEVADEVTGTTVISVVVDSGEVAVGVLSVMIDDDNDDEGKSVDDIEDDKSVDDEESVFVVVEEDVVGSEVVLSAVGEDVWLSVVSPM